jgi:hypothetical protein
VKIPANAVPTAAAAMTHPSKAPAKGPAAAAATPAPSGEEPKASPLKLAVLPPPGGNVVLKSVGGPKGASGKAPEKLAPQKTAPVKAPPEKSAPGAAPAKAAPSVRTLPLTALLFPFLLLLFSLESFVLFAFFFFFPFQQKGGPGPVRQNATAQKKAFSGWLNYKLLSRGIEVTSLVDGALADGKVLTELLDVLGCSPIPDFKAGAQSPEQQMANISAILRALQEKGIDVKNISTEDVHKGNIKGVLPLLWKIISASYEGSLQPADGM